MLNIVAVVLALVGCAAVTFACLRGSSDALAAVGVVLPMVSAGVTVAAWLHERHKTNGDPEPGLVLLTGGAVTAAFVLGAVGGALSRARSESRQPAAKPDGGEASGNPSSPG